MLRGLSVKAVIIGVVLDWALSFVVGLISGIALMIYFVVVLRESPTDRAAFDALIKSDLSCFGVCLGGGLACVLAGFVTGWVATSYRIQNALAAGIISAVSSLILLPLLNGYPEWYVPACLVITVAGCALGGVIAHRIFGETTGVESRPI